MTSLEIAMQQADFARNSGVTATIDTAFGWVTLDDGEAELFLQGYQAEKFIDKVLLLWEELQHIDMGDAELAVAYDYLDVMTPKD